MQYDTARSIIDSLEGADFYLIGNNQTSIYKLGKAVLTDEEKRKRYDPDAIPVKDANEAAQFKPKDENQSDKPIKLYFTVPPVKDTIGNLLLWNKKTDSIFVHENMTKEYVNTAEKTPVINWVITDETKKIKEYNCHKATTHFRGRNYIVWFTTEIPIVDGPWKFKGLPGLIVDLADDKKQVRIYAEIIEYPSSTTVPNILFNTISGKWVNIAKYIEYHNEYVQKQITGFIELTNEVQNISSKQQPNIKKTGYYGIEKKLD